MMVLTLLTKQIDSEFTVYWKTGLQRGGELKVDLGEQYDKLPEQQKPIAAILHLGQLTRDIVVQQRKHWQLSAITLGSYWQVR
ncbi:hypothetical protein [Pseudoalteromonas sp. DL-6]|uniref:hypothetical protein n=1 Tax=Pseudoalteromonas sp. DL-6 TaxID=1390185 RepID=UPI00103ECF02|nr:hypothetical protein [Pseudoalteromonas sp. DL-6]